MWLLDVLLVELLENPEKCGTPRSPMCGPCLRSSPPPFVGCCCSLTGPSDLLKGATPPAAEIVFGDGEGHRSQNTVHPGKLALEEEAH